MITLNSKSEILTYFNQQRKANKNKWLFLTIQYKNLIIQIKSYNTWIQVLQVTNIEKCKVLKDSSVMDLSVKAINDWLDKSFDYLLNRMEQK